MLLRLTSTVLPQLRTSCATAVHVLRTSAAVVLGTRLGTLLALRALVTVHFQYLPVLVLPVVCAQPAMAFSASHSVLPSALRNDARFFDAMAAHVARAWS